MQETCFVIMPFSDQFNDIYSDVLTPAIESAGFKAVRGDSVYSVRPVIEDIFLGIRSAPVLVADVTDKNPNVNYELGVAHALNKPTIIISQTIEDVPFDYRHLRTILYNIKSVTWVAQLTDKIVNTLSAVRAEGASRLNAQHEGRNKALVGKWVGKVEQNMPEGLSYAADLEMAMTQNGIAGVGLLSDPRVEKSVEVRFSCSILYDQFVRLEYVGADATTIQFGSWVARLSGDGKKIEGSFVGYGSITDKIVTGYAALQKQK